MHWKIFKLKQFKLISLLKVFKTACANNNANISRFTTLKLENHNNIKTVKRNRSLSNIRTAAIILALVLLRYFEKSHEQKTMKMYYNYTKRLFENHNNHFLQKTNNFLFEHRCKSNT